MLTEKCFKENLAMLSENFSLQISQTYQKMVFAALKDRVTDGRMKNVTMDIIMTKTLEDWNNKYGYGKLPTVKDWLDGYEIKPEKKTIYYKCEQTGATLSRIEWVMPDNLKQITNV
jgi:hypothetical protein